VLTYIGLFEYEGKVKGLILLLEVVKKLRLRYPNILLMIAGKGSLKKIIDDKVHKLSLRDNVSILENITNPFNLLKISNLHCHITHQDSFGLAVLEALSAGVPVVASAVGELPNIGVRGLTVVENRLDLLAAAVEQYLEKPPVVDIASLSKKFKWTNTVAELNTIMCCDSHG
jgi:glycosyltransferase involved in cell wall biosynthesis